MIKKKKKSSQLNVKIVLSLFTKHGCIVYTLIFRLLCGTWKLSLFKKKKCNMGKIFDFFARLLHLLQLLLQSFFHPFPCKLKILIIPSFCWNTDLQRFLSNMTLRYSARIVDWLNWLVRMPWFPLCLFHILDYILSINIFGFDLVLLCKF